ncbi:MAG: T9SS type A sorting domain-containing protein [Caldithrix sp.]|nr:T9SS type A sorting domain-containing protein [Caldithrix sp.]
MGAYEFESATSINKTMKETKNYAYERYPNYPNPFNTITRIVYRLNLSGHTVLTVYDILGKAIEVQVNAYQTSGRYSLSWNAESLPSGMYFLCLKPPTGQQTRRMMLQK